MCDRPECNLARMSAKEGDNMGIESVRKRLDLDEQLINKVLSLHGVHKVSLRNAIPVKEAGNLVDDYEITPSYVYRLEGDKVKVEGEPYVVEDDDGEVEDNVP